MTPESASKTFAQVNPEGWELRHCKIEVLSSDATSQSALVRVCLGKKCMRIQVTHEWLAAALKT